MQRESQRILTQVCQDVACGFAVSLLENLDRQLCWKHLVDLEITCDRCSAETNQTIVLHGGRQRVDPSTIRHVVFRREFEQENTGQQRRAIFNRLREATDNQQWIGLDGRHANPLKNHEFFDETGCLIPFERVQKIVRDMMGEGTVIKVDGKGLVAEDF